MLSLKLSESVDCTEWYTLGTVNKLQNHVQNKDNQLVNTRLDLAQLCTCTMHCYCVFIAVMHCAYMYHASVGRIAQLRRVKY